MAKKFYGLIIPKKQEKVQTKSKSIFESDSDDDAPPLRMKPKFGETSAPARSSRAKAQEEKLMADDPTIYEYDDIYETIQEKKLGKQVEEKQKKQPRFINSLLKAADKRKKDHDRRQEKKIQVERTKEGDEFKDKEVFVTSAYKKKMQELEVEEQRERLENQLDEMMDVTKQEDLGGFYRHYLKQIVGEEKVPEFGERSARIKPDPDGDTSPVQMQPKETVPDKPKKPAKYRSRQRSESLSDSDLPSPRNTKEPKIQVKRSNSDEDSPSPKKHKLDSIETTTKNDENDQHNSLVNYDEDADDDDIVSEPEVSDKPETKQPTEDVPTKPTKPDMTVKFIKRTVGTVFDAAQQRYFKRVAARGS